MAATITIRRRTGTSGAPTNTDVTAATTRVSCSDSPTPAATNPCVIPSSGTNYSWWMSWYLNADTTPAGTIDTVKWYTSGSSTFGTGITYLVGTAAAYTQAVGSATTGTQLLAANYTGLSPATPTNAFAYTSASPLAVTGTLSNPSTGKISDFVVQQMGGDSTVVAGVATAQTFTFSDLET
jgi:hypothetical protein